MDLSIRSFRMSTDKKNPNDLHANNTVLTSMETGGMSFSLHAPRADIMQVIQQGCQQIIMKYGSGNTEAFYQRMLLLYLYERSIPSVAEIDCFVLNSDRTPVLVGRIDIEVQHDTILEIKVAPQITDKHLQQLRKYVNARLETGMNIRHAALVCFTDKEQVDIRILSNTGSRSTC